MNILKKLIITVTFIFIMSCGSQEPTLIFSDTFNADNTVTDSIFSKTVYKIEGTFKMKLISVGVSSGFIKLNDIELMKPNDFKNDSFMQILDIDLENENTIEVEVRGKPGDQLCVQVYEIENDQTERIIYERCVDREAGPPNNVTVIIKRE